MIPPHPPLPPHYVRRNMKNRNWGVGRGRGPRTKKTTLSNIDVFAKWTNEDLFSFTRMTREFLEVYFRPKNDIQKSRIYSSLMAGKKLPTDNRKCKLSTINRWLIMVIVTKHHHLSNYSPVCPWSTFCSQPLLHIKPKSRQKKKRNLLTTHKNQVCVLLLIPSVHAILRGKVCQRKTTVKYNGRVFVEAGVIIEIFNHTLTFTTPWIWTANHEAWGVVEVCERVLWKSLKKSAIIFSVNLHKIIL